MANNFVLRFTFSFSLLLAISLLTMAKSDLAKFEAQALELQAKARLGACQHAVGVLLWSGQKQIDNDTAQKSTVSVGFTFLEIYFL